MKQSTLSAYASVFLIIIAAFLLTGDIFKTVYILILVAGAVMWTATLGAGLAQAQTDESKKIA